jgi:methylglutaconyl-CoA hydratase
MSAPLILVESDARGISRLTLNRPDKRNALSIALLDEFLAALQTLAESSSQRVLILQGAGPLFCAGMDLQEAANPEQVEEVTHLIYKVLLALYRSPLVTIAAVHGTALGGGAGLMAACDLVVATEETKIGFPETRRGLVAALIAAILLRELCPRDVREILLTGSLFEVKRAFELHLVNRITAFADLLPAVNHLANEILLGGPESVRATKRMLEALAPSSLERDFEITMAYSKDSRKSSEAEEGIRAFLEKREPRWS